ncbi:MAG: hypothetical protein WCO60_18000 [Verrucomicrobiota bacterium]
MNRALLLSVLLTPFLVQAIEPISAPAEILSKKLDAMEVEKHWISGAIVDWRTGDPSGKTITDIGKHTHCSQFVAATCERLGVYILRPPEHSPTLLANAQYDWLHDAGRDAGWSPVASGVEAQDQANRGRIVVAVYKNHDQKKSGHIAIVRPDQKSEAEISQNGPTVIQAGGTNYNQTTLRKGFANHPNGFEEIRFFSHPIPQ